MMHQNFLEYNSLGAIRTGNIAVNFAVVLLFALLNPLYAVSICAVLNFLNYKINFWIFSVMFATSFGLFYFLRDWSIGYDAIAFLQEFQTVNSLSFRDIFNQFVANPHNRELLWFTYLWLMRSIGDRVELFAFLNMFIIFLLTAYLGKVVNEKRFVVIILCILFVDLGFLYNVYQVWRHTFALLLFFIGIFLIEADKHRRLARVLMYSSALFHLVAIPIVAGYEFFTICNKINARSLQSKRFHVIIRYSIVIVVYTIFAVLFFILMDKYGTRILPIQYEIYVARDIADTRPGYGYLFNPLSYVLIFYLWFNRKKISKNDIFIGINYFVAILVLLIIALPGTPVGRIIYFFLVGASILSGKLVLTGPRLGSICLFTIIFYTFNILSKPVEFRGLSQLLGGDFLNPTYGLVGMISYYDTSALSNLLSNIAF